jgi:hypothetical protein
MIPRPDAVCALQLILGELGLTLDEQALDGASLCSLMRKAALHGATPSNV